MREYGRFVGLALTVSQPGALLFVQSLSHSPSFSLSLPLLHFACVWVCLLLTKFVGIFVLYSVTFILCLSTHSPIFFLFCLLLFLRMRFVRSTIYNCRFICYSKLFLSIVDETPKLHRKKARKKNRRKNFCYAWLNSYL